ncbi:MAG: hypothetical protein ISP82_07690, partial [Candidatus Poseidoniaceae archaeon]|nr:hypothetical protein [Candidatus Poseidoniaceae archaeon]
MHAQQPPSGSLTMPGGHASHWMSAQSSTGDPVVLLFPDELFESLSPL